MEKVLHKNDFKLLNTSKTGEKILFYTPNSQIFSIEDPSIKEYLAYCESGNEIELSPSQKNKYKAIHAELEDAFANGDQPFVDNIATEVKMDTLILPISGKCNLRCSYCFASENGNFHFEGISAIEAREIVDRLFSDMELDEVYLSFFGGEPLLNVKTIRYIINYIQTYYPSKSVNYSITTNGTIMNDEILEIIKTYNIPLLISLDGPKEVNNHRLFPNKKESFELVLKNINFLRENDVSIYLRSTMASDKLNIVETHDFFEKIGLPFNIIYAHDTITGIGELSSFELRLNQIKEEYEKLITYYLDLIDKQKTINCLTIKDKLVKFFYRNKSHYACTGGRSLFSITADGEIYSCEHLSGLTDFSVGNLNDGGIDSEKLQALQAIDVDEIEDCSKCWLRYICSGGCFSNNISATGNSRIPDHNKCELIRAEYEFIIKLYHEINAKYPDFFDVVDKTS